MNSSFIIKLMFHNQDGAIKSKSKELEKSEMTELPYHLHYSPNLIHTTG